MNTERLLAVRDDVIATLVLLWVLAVAGAYTLGQRQAARRQKPIDCWQLSHGGKLHTRADCTQLTEAKTPAEPASWCKTCIKHLHREQETKED